MFTSNYKPTDKEEEFLKYHDSLRDELNTANWHFAICKYMRDLAKDYLREFNIAPAFFQLTMSAHLYETVMRLCRFFDRRDDSMSIFQLLDLVESNQQIFSNPAFEKRVRSMPIYNVEVQNRVIQDHVAITPQIVERDIQRLGILPLQNLKKWRHKALAHTDKKSVLEGINIFNRYPLETEQIDQIIDTLHEILNGYYIAYNATECDKNLSIEGGIKEVLDSIRFRNIAQKRQ